MATLIPSLGSARFDSRGELRPCLSASKTSSKRTPTSGTTCRWARAAGIPTLSSSIRQKGLLVLEVKDWRMDTIASANKSDVELVTTSGTIRTIGPFEQGRGYMFDVMKLIRLNGVLLHPPGHPHQGKSIVPFGYGIVFTNITRKQFAQTDLDEVFPEDRSVLKDEMSESGFLARSSERLRRRGQDRH